MLAAFCPWTRLFGIRERERDFVESCVNLGKFLFSSSFLEAAFVENTNSKIFK